MNLTTKKMKQHLAKLKVAKAHGKTYTCKNTYLQRKHQNNQQMVKT
jgi:heterodisulfide reductase subunit B